MTEKLTVHQGKVVPLDRANVDTDAIIPKKYLKSVERVGFGKHLFAEWRYKNHEDDDKREVEKDFVLNLPQFKGGSILLARRNFGCGSSREHAVWALADYGFKVVLAPSFADIFFNNCFKNFVLPIVLHEKDIDDLFVLAQQDDGIRLTINLVEQFIELTNGIRLSFEIDPFKKHCLVEGLDEIALTLQMSNEIKTFEAKHQEKFPWLFNDTADSEKET